MPPRPIHYPSTKHPTGKRHQEHNPKKKTETVQSTKKSPPNTHARHEPTPMRTNSKQPGGNYPGMDHATYTHPTTAKTPVSHSKQPRQTSKPKV